MPYKNPEVRRVKAREYSRRSREKHREQHNARTRQLRADDPERFRGYQTRYRENNRDRINAAQQVYYVRWYEENRERKVAQMQEYRDRNRDQVRERDNTRYQSGGKREKMRIWRLQFKHGMTPDDLIAMWEDQQGFCYLCGDNMHPEKFVIEHDHSCCPAEQSCPVCRRGLSCGNCNSAIGMAQDDPARLRRMADALELAIKGVEQRKVTRLDS